MDNAGNISPLSRVKSGRTQIDSSTENKDDIPPSQVVGVVVSVASSTTLKLAWTQNTELDFGHYNIYSGTKEGLNVTPGKTSPELTSIANSVSITGLNPSTKYYYKIAAVDNTGNIGPLSSEVSASTPSEQNITSSSKGEVRNNNQNPTSEIAKQDTGNQGVENKNIDTKVSNSPVLRNQRDKSVTPNSSSSGTSAGGSQGSNNQNCVGQVVNSTNIHCSPPSGSQGSHNQNCVGQIVHSSNTSCGPASSDGTQGPPGPQAPPGPTG